MLPDDQAHERAVPTPEETWVIRESPDLRIIDPELAARVDAQGDEWQRRYEAGKAQGRAPHRAHGKYLLSGGMLLCPTCEGHFEAFTSPWLDRGVHRCARARRKPGTCSNTIRLDIEETDHAVVDVVEGEVLGRSYVDRLLALVDHDVVDERPGLQAQVDERQAEVRKLVESIAVGVPAETVAPLIREKQREIARLEAEIRRPRPERLDVERLRAALEQKRPTGDACSEASAGQAAAAAARRAHHAAHACARLDARLTRRVGRRRELGSASKTAGNAGGSGRCTCVGVLSLGELEPARAVAPGR